MRILQIKTFARLREVLATHDGGTLFARWSRGPSKDQKQGVSRDAVTGRHHAGLSASMLDAEWTDAQLARRVKEYQFLRLKDNAIRCYLYVGEQCGTDSDGYESINIIGDACYRVTESVIAECMRIGV